MQPATAQLAAGLDDYERRWPAELADVALFRALLEAGAAAFHRERVEAHFTGSAWLISRDGKRVLLTHHRKLGRWLQLGGHSDGDSDLAAVALREAEEESGLSDLRGERAIFDIDRHRIPARGVEAAHWHCDVRYVIRCAGDEAFAVGPESLDLAWRDIADLADGSDVDPSLQRMARKWLSRIEASAGRRPKRRGERSRKDRCA